MKKNKWKGIVVLLVMCILLSGIGISVQAAIPKEHECAFSVMGIDCYSRVHIAYHSFKDEAGEEHICEVTLGKYRVVYKCACQEMFFRDYHNVANHSERCEYCSD